MFWRRNRHERRGPSKSDEAAESAPLESERSYEEGDWLPISIKAFGEVVESSDEPVGVLVSKLVLERLPHTFDSVGQYINWRHHLAQGLGVDARDILLIGSACTGRSLSGRKKYGVFGSKSDLDIAVVSSLYFDIAWDWFRSSSPVAIGLDEDQQKRFKAHRSHYVYEGVIAADVFISYFDFGGKWLKAAQASEHLLPERLKGRPQAFRIYRDVAALRSAQSEALTQYQKYIGRIREESEHATPGLP